jgi:2'-5' RNA ligase
METIRAFIAIQIPDEIKLKFAEAQAKLRRSGADVRWVNPDNAHVTLQFLGNAPVEKIEAIGPALNRVATSHRAFDITIAGLGVFPNLKRPRVVWIGIVEGAESLSSLQAAVVEEMSNLSFESEKRPYSPHITLGRVKTAKNADRLSSALDADRDFQAGRFRATEIHLIRSVLSSEGPTYSTLFSASLLPPLS